MSVNNNKENQHKAKSNVDIMDELLNHIRSQLDFLCESAKYQNAILRELYKNSNDSSN